MSVTQEFDPCTPGVVASHTSTASLKTGRELISYELFERLTGRIVADHGMERDTADRILDQALAFLAASASHAGESSLSPSRLVDIGWHTFLLYTRDYAAFCQRVAGRFIHHVPDDAPGAPARTRPAENRDRTIAAITAAGFAVDEPLWTLGALDCGSCHEDGNCSASGPDGTENKDTRKKG
jgi:hypothetical protein